LGGFAGGAWWLWIFVYEELAPLVETNLTQTLSRPVKLGIVESFSLTGLQFGASSIPATKTDPDSVSVDAVEVNFNLLRLALTRNLNLDVTLINPNIYIQQDAQGRWISTRVKAEEKAGPITTDLDTIRFQNGDVVLVPNAAARGTSQKIMPVAAGQVSGFAQFLENNQLIQFALGGQMARGGTLAMQGKYRPSEEYADLQIQTQNLLASDVTRLVPLPLNLQAGRVDGNLIALLRKEQQAKLFGTAALKAVTAKVNQLPQAFINSQGTLRFNSTVVGLDNVSTSYGKIGAIANGVLDTQAGYNISARVPAVTVANAQQTLNIQLPVSASGVVQANVNLTGPIAKPVLLGTVATIKPARIDRVDFSNISTSFAYSTANSSVAFKDIIATPKVGGKITGAGIIQLGTKGGLGFELAAQNIPGDAIARLYGISPQIRIGTVSATTAISGTSTKPQTIVNWQAPQATYPAQGNILIADKNTLIFRDTVVSLAGGIVQATGQLINNRWQASVQANNVQLGRLTQVPPALQAPLSGRFNLSGTTASFQPQAIAATGSGQVQVAGGIVTASNIQLAGGRWQAQLQATGVQLGQLTQVPPALQAPLSGRFNLSGTTASFQPETIRGTGQGRLNVAGGTVTATNIQLDRGRWQAQLQASGVQLGQLTQVPPAFQGALTGRFNLSGTTASFQPGTIRGTGQGRLNVAGGTVTATNIQLAQGQWQALVDASQVQLNKFSDQLRGRFSGQLKVAGTLDSTNLADIRGAGRVRFSQGIGIIQQPLTALVGWDGEKIIVQQATAPNLRASGLIFAKVEGSAPEITGLNLNVQAQNYNLQELPFALPNAVDLVGKADFAGQVSGTLPTPNVVGALRLRDLVVNNLAFEPVLTGNVQVAAGRGVELNATGTQDRIAFNLDPNYRPKSFLIQRDQALAIGQSQGENLLVNIENFPLTALNITPPNPAFGPGPVAGLLTGDFQVNQATYALVGDVAIAQPAIGRIKGDSFVGKISYGNGVASLSNGEFTLNQSRYALAGSLTQTSNGPEFKGQVNIAQGQIQDILTALQFFDLQDLSRGLQPPTYARATALQTVPVGLPEATLLTQLRRFSEIEALLQRQRQQRQNTFSLPSLADLEGTFNGQISVDGSLQKGVAINFDLEGNQWKWGDYDAERVIAEGSFKDGVLTLLPLRIESDETLLAFSGQIGGTQQSGQLQVRNFPLEMVDKFASLPIDVTGKLNATATLAGTIDNPQAVGELQLVEGTLNQSPVKSALGSFSYANARLNFGSNVVVSGPDPIAITGSIPYKLPFAAIAPDNNEISLNVNVRNEGLALLNLFTDTVAWQDGEGQVELQVRGTTQQPIATGIASVNNATITAPALPEPLTDVAGKLQFNFDRILVENLQGKFSRGQVVAQGVIPIFKNLQPNDPDITKPLAVSLDNLALNLPELYQGGASGNVIVTGTALSPIVGGDVRLADGRVLLAEAADTTTTVSSDEEQQNNSGQATQAQIISRSNTPSSEDSGPLPEFNNLRLTLGDDIAIARPPILNFQATGTLTLNGPRNDLRPDGTIRLRRGSVNLFTTQFVLARGYEHTATFSPNQGLDPTLDIRLIAAVPEITQRRVPSSSISSEIAETLSTDVEGLRTVRVQARVTGPASQLFDNLELTSNPSRSQSEIIALIGGGFVDTLGRGDSALGLVNFASSAILGNFQGTVTSLGNAIGLSELRLFPTLTTEERSRASTLGLAAEAGIDISRNTYFSILRILTANQPTQFGLSYRVNEQVRVRASTDFSGESRAVVEYENRF
jgi:translocation and assembly module TamB